MTGETSDPTKKFTVAQVGRAVQKMLKERAPGMWVVGELIEFERNAGKVHKYATLVEKNERGEIIASLRIIMWNSVYPGIERTLQNAPRPFELKDNIEVCFKIRLEFYLPGGALSGIVTEVDPTHTLSELEKKRIEILKILTQEGILGNNRQLPLPGVLTRIGLITGRESAGEADFISELKRSSYAFQVYTCYAAVQGKQTETSVTAALRALSELPLDVICIIRGGGSRVDLAWFDSETIARAILALNIPVFSGIGHDIDVCVVDDIASRHFKTPTAAAQAIVAGVDEFLSECAGAFESIRGVWEGRIGEALRTLDDNRAGLAKGTGKIADLSRRDFFNFALRFKGEWSERNQSERLRFAEIHQDLRRLPANLSLQKRRLSENTLGLRLGGEKIAESETKDFTLAAEKLKNRWRTQFQKQMATVEGLGKLLESSHPDRVLKRGYSITLNAKGMALDRAAVKTGDEMTTLTFKKRIQSKITEVKDK